MPLHIKQNKTNKNLEGESEELTCVGTGQSEAMALFFDGKSHLELPMPRLTGVSCPHILFIPCRGHPVGAIPWSSQSSGFLNAQGEPAAEQGDDRH